MSAKIMIGLLGLAIVIVIGVGLADATRPIEDLPSAAMAQAAASTVAPQVPAQTTPNVTAAANRAAGSGAGSAASSAANSTANPGAAQDIGDTWKASGTITRLDDTGFDFQTDSGSVYVELGPSSYWQAQGVLLAVNDKVTVDGFANGEQFHARVVTVGESQLVVRTVDGKPMWSGGAQGGNGQENAGGTPNPEIQVKPEDWVTVKGTLASVTNGGVTLTASDGTTLKLQMGQSRFWQSQGVTLTAGDAVEVLGYWSNGQFMVGDILKIATGEHIILRDPNGRQLWGGPGRNGSTSGGSGGNGNGGNGNGGNGNGGNGNATNHPASPAPAAPTATPAQ